MRLSYVIFDDFYDDPDAVRKYALEQKYDIIGNYPGYRTRDNDFLDENKREGHNLGVKKFFQSYFDRPIMNWGNSYNGSFQYVEHNHNTWIHKDAGPSVTHASLIYLHPDPPPGNYGTLFFKHLESGTHLCSNVDEVDDKISGDGEDRRKWEIVDYAGYKYNRMIIYDARLWHCATNYFGDNVENSRLFQCFFFTVDFNEL